MGWDGQKRTFGNLMHDRSDRILIYLHYDVSEAISSLKYGGPCTRFRAQRVLHQGLRSDELNCDVYCIGEPASCSDPTILADQHKGKEIDQ